VPLYRFASACVDFRRAEFHEVPISGTRGVRPSDLDTAPHPRIRLKTGVKTAYGAKSRKLHCRGGLGVQFASKARVGAIPILLHQAPSSLFWGLPKMRLMFLQTGGLRTFVHNHLAVNPPPRPGRSAPMAYPVLKGMCENAQRKQRQNLPLLG
jgi:hypothetical protein